MNANEIFGRLSIPEYDRDQPSPIDGYEHPMNIVEGRIFPAYEPLPQAAQDTIYESYLLALELCSDRPQYVNDASRGVSNALNVHRSDVELYGWKRAVDEDMLILFDTSKFTIKGT